jgi:subtilisin family serine protease
VPPRIKPDVCAQGSGVRVASATNPTSYTSSSGTSFSCPLTAGVAALIVKARPNATPYQIANAMRMTASRASTPDNQYGWGIVNALAAINYLPTTDAPEQNTQPKQFSLEQNYPNPFNPTTTIRFSLVETGHTSLKVFDVLGRAVATLVDETMQAGTHHVTLDASRFASGTYFYKLQSGNNIAVKKLMVVK